MPSSGDSDLPSFGQQPETPSASTPSYADASQLSFLERFRELPLVRSAMSHVQDIYQSTKDRNGLLKGALERGESTVNYSISCAADVLSKSGLSSRLQKPLSMADSSACFVLNKMEAKLPIIAMSPYEIKLMFTDNIDSTLDRYKSTVEVAKHKGLGTVQAALDTSYGQKLNQTFDRGLTVVDSVVDRILPEGGHSHKNGNGNGNANGHYIHTNGHHFNGTLDHAKSLSRKVKRRFSSKSSDMVDSVLQNSTVATVAGIAKKNIESTRNLASEVVGEICFKASTLAGSMMKVWNSGTSFILPKSIHEKITVLLDGTVMKAFDVAAKVFPRSASRSEVHAQ